MFKTYFLIALIILLFLLSSCAGQKATIPPQPPPETPVTAMNTDEPFTLTEEQNGGTVALIVNDTVRVKLDGNPTTGFTWETENLDASLLQRLGEPDFARNSNLTGSGGAFTFAFKARKEGSTHLRLIYHRPFEKDKAPLRIFDVIVDIQK